AIGNLTLSGATSHFKLSSEGCSNQTLEAANASCTAQLKFAPATVGMKNAVLSIPTSASAVPEAVALSGTGTPPTPTPTPALPNPSIKVTSSPLIAGHVASLEGKDFTGLDRLSVYVRSTPILVAAVIANEIGSFATTFTIPASTTTGTHTIEVRRAGSSTVLASTPVTIQAAVSSAQPTK